MAGDAKFENVAILLNCDGPNGSTSIVDSGPHSMAVQAFGSAQIKTDQSVFGGASLYLGGGAYLRSAHSELFRADGDFTCEMRIRPSSPSSLQYLATKRDTTSLQEWSFYIEASKLKLALFSSGVQRVDLTSVTDIAMNTWSRVAWERQGDTYRLFVGETVEASTTVPFTYGTNTDPLTIGRDPQAGSGRDFTGYIDEFRITKGFARSTGAPEVGPFPAYAGQISGTVKEDGLPVSRVLRAYRRDTGVLAGTATSDSGTGAYTINCKALAECSVICLDDAAGTTYQDLVSRATPA